MMRAAFRTIQLESIEALIINKYAVYTHLYHRKAQQQVETIQVLLQDKRKYRSKAEIDFVLQWALAYSSSRLAAEQRSNIPLFPGWRSSGFTTNPECQKIQDSLLDLSFNVF